MAMMSMVRSIKNAGETDYDPEIRKADVIYREVVGEHMRALEVCSRILNRQGWTWELIEEELHQMPSDGWEFVGEELDLSYLKVTSYRAL